MTLKIIIFVFLTILSYAGVFFLRQWLEKRRILDHPNERSSHEVPTPRGGGWLIVIITLVTVLAFAIAAQKWNQSLVYVGLGTLIAWIGWLDDVSSLSTRFRFLMQGIAAALVIVFIGYFKSVTIPVFGEIQFGFLAIPITFVWIIGLTNAYNFMDGIDGIAGVETVTIAAGYVAVSYAAGGAGGTFHGLALAIAGATLGFLVWNWAPARIFLGDVGAVPLGFLTGAMMIDIAVNQSLVAALILPLYFAADATITLARRVLEGAKPWEAHRDHFYQRAARGLGSHAAVATRVLVCNGVLVIAAVFALTAPLPAIVLAVAAVAALLTSLERAAAS